MIKDPWLRLLVIVMCAIAGIYLTGLLWTVVQQFADIALMFFLAWLLAFVLEPVVVSLVEGVRLPRRIAILVTYLTMLVVLGTSIVLLVPALTTQLVQIANNLPSYAEQIAAWTATLESSTNHWLADRGAPLMVDVRSALNPTEMSRRIEALGPPILSNVAALATGVATLLVGVVVVLILSYYFMSDGARISQALIAALPPRAQDDARYLEASIHRAFAGFLRGQVIQALLSGVGTAVVMQLLGVQYALLGGVVAAVILLIPFVGPVVAVWLPVTIALFTNPSAVLVLLIVLVAMQQVIFNIIAPRIMSRQVGIHPLLVFFAVLAGARVAGIWGAIFGVPVVAVFVTMLTFYRSSRDERTAILQEQLSHERVAVDLNTPETSTSVS